MVSRQGSGHGWALPLAIAAVVIACFAPALGGEFLSWDDQMNFTHNPHYRGLGPAQLAWMFTTRSGHYIPLTWLSLGLDYTLWGMNPRGYHLTSLLLHASNAVLCYLLLRRLLGFAADNRWAAAAGALLFAIHPLRVESVAWISERRDVLAGFFFLLSLLAYVRASADPQKATRWRMASLGCFVASLLSKTIGIALPVILLLLDATVLGRLSLGERKSKPRARRILVEKAPFFAVAGAAAVMAVIAERHANALPGLGNLPPGWSLVQPGYRIAFYAGKILWPLDLAPLYYHPLGAGAFLPRYLFGAAVAVALTAGLFVWRHRWPQALAAWLGFVALLAPGLGIPQVAAHVAADRTTYLPSLVWSLMAAAAVRKLLLARDAGHVTESRFRGVAAGSALVLVALGGLSFRYTGVWKDSLSLWNRAIAYDGTLFTAFDARGSARAERGDLEGAIADFTRAVEINPDFADAYSDRGIVRMKQQDLERAIADFSAAVRLNPGFADAYNNRGVARARKQDADGAAADFTQAIALNGHALAHNGRGLLRKDRGDRAGALADFSAAVAAKPDYGEAYNNRGALRMEQQDVDGAIADFTLAARLDPQANVYNNRGAAWLMRGDPDRALTDFTAAIRLDPRLLGAYLNRAGAYLKKGDWPGAVKDALAARALAPREPAVANLLARIESERTRAAR